MKIRIPNVAELMLGLALAGLAVIGGFMVARAIEPPRLTWESISVSVEGSLLIVDAETVRRENEGCTNGVQAEMRDVSGTVTRLPAPVREIRSDGSSRYEIELPVDTLPGEYGLRLRESYYCDGRPDISVAPWIEFRVV